MTQDPHRVTSSFWEHKSANDLAKEQGVGPLRSWEQLQGDWPEDAEFEEFLAAVKSARQDNFTGS